jgi:hypothetical protein
MAGRSKPHSDARPVHIPPVHHGSATISGWQTNPHQAKSIGPPVAKRRFLLQRPAADAPGPGGRGDPRPTPGRQVEPSPSGAVSFCRIAACPVSCPWPLGLLPNLSLQLLLITAAINSHAAFHVRAHVLAFRSPRGGRCPPGSTAGELAVGGRWGHHGTGQGTDTARPPAAAEWDKDRILSCRAGPTMSAPASVTYRTSWFKNSKSSPSAEGLS